MSDQKLKDFLKKGARSVPHASPYEYQLIMRRIRHEDSTSKRHAWQLWGAFGFSAAALTLLMTLNWHDDRNVEEDLFHDLDNAEFVDVHQSGGYKDWLQLAEYSSPDDDDDEQSSDL